MILEDPGVPSVAGTAGTAVETVPMLPLLPNRERLRSNRRPPKISLRPRTRMNADERANVIHSDTASRLFIPPPSGPPSNGNSETGEGFRPVFNQDSRFGFRAVEVRSHQDSPQISAAKGSVVRIISREVDVAATTNKKPRVGSPLLEESSQEDFSVDVASPVVPTRPLPQKDSLILKEFHREIQFEQEQKQQVSSHSVRSAFQGTQI